MKLKGKLVPIFGIAALSTYPCFFMYFQNAGEARFIDILGISAALLIAAVIILGILYLCIRDWIKATVVAEIGMLLFLNFALIERIFLKVFPFLYYWHVVLILLFFWIVCGFLIVSYLPDLAAEAISTVVLVAFSALIVINGLSAIPKITDKLSAEYNGAVQEIITASSEAHPNFYLFVFDEYGGQENLERYCNFDNADFYQSLSDLGFTVSKTSHNETYETATVVPNLFNLQYINSYNGGAVGADEVAIKESKLVNPYLYQLLLGNGYDLNVLDSDNFLDATSSKYRYEPTSTNVESTATYYILQNTAAYPFYQDNGSVDLQNMHMMIEYGEKSSTLQESNLFTAAYFCNPHVPWFVDENGHEISGLDRMNYRNPDVYLGQLKYLNKCVVPMLTNIIENDPNSVIMLIGDHGYRQVTHLPELFDDVEAELPHLTSVLNAVYYQGEPIDIEGDTGINTLIKIVNKLLNIELQPVDPNEYNGV